MFKKRELLFSVTKKDFVIEPFKGSGKGGQHRNKTMSCVRIRHPESGAEAIATENRDQRKNRRLAFRRLVESSKFQIWRKRKAYEMMHDQHELERKLERAMNPKNIKLEIYDTEKNKWIEANDSDLRE